MQDLIHTSCHGLHGANQEPWLLLGSTGPLKEFEFLRLPAEIRDAIYVYSLRAETAICLLKLRDDSVTEIAKVNKPSTLGLLLVNKQIYHESVKILYSENVFEVWWPFDLTSFEIIFGAENCKHVKEMSFLVICFSNPSEQEAEEDENIDLDGDGDLCSYENLINDWNSALQKCKLKNLSRLVIRAIPYGSMTVSSAPMPESLREAIIEFIKAGDNVVPHITLHGFCTEESEKFPHQWKIMTIDDSRFQEISNHVKHMDHADFDHQILRLHRESAIIRNVKESQHERDQFPKRVIGQRGSDRRGVLYHACISPSWARSVIPTSSSIILFVIRERPSPVSVLIPSIEVLPSLPPAIMGLDPHNLARFVTAQNGRGSYDNALAEIKAGRKRSHWMWYNFSQFVGLSTSQMGNLYAIKSIAEARAYIAHPVLGPRLLEISQAVLTTNTRTALALMGRPDDAKLQSCMTLFNLASQEPVFAQVLQKYYTGRDQQSGDIWNRLEGA